MTTKQKNPTRSGAGARRKDTGQGVVIDLSAAQVDQVLKAASAGGSVSVLLSGLKISDATLSAGLQRLDNRSLSRSLLAGLVMLASLPSDGSYVRVVDVARLLDMKSSTAHRYLSTLVAVGLAERDAVTRRYRLAR